MHKLQDTHDWPFTFFLMVLAFGTGAMIVVLLTNDQRMSRSITETVPQHQPSGPKLIHDEPPGEWRDEPPGAADDIPAVDKPIEGPGFSAHGPGRPPPLPGEIVGKVKP